MIKNNSRVGGGVVFLKEEMGQIIIHTRYLSILGNLLFWRREENYFIAFGLFRRSLVHSSYCCSIPY